MRVSVTIRRGRDALARRYRWAVESEPPHEQGLRRPLRELRRTQSVAAVAILDLNNALLARFGPKTEVWPTARWRWIPELEANVGAIRQEFEQFASRRSLPHTAEIAGLDPDSEQARRSLPLESGTWRGVALFVDGAWAAEAAAFPVTTAMFDQVAGRANVGFSVLGARSHLRAHRDPNRGALRLHLPVVVPGSRGDCRLRVGDAVLPWVEGQAVVFDLNAEHEAWNDTDQDRVVLTAEIEVPLSQPWSTVNRAAQYSFRWHPSFRGRRDRLADGSRGPTDR